VAKYTIVLPTTATGSFTTTLTNPTAVNRTGGAIVMKAGAPLVINIVQGREDINSDGKIDAIDLLILVDQILGRSECGTSDVNGDGKCDLTDALLIAQAGISQ
jgi:hypothetical protein